MSEEELQMEQAIRLSQISHASEVSIRSQSEISNENYGGQPIPGLPLDEPILHENNGKTGQKNAQNDEEPVMHGEPVMMIP